MTTLTRAEIERLKAKIPLSELFELYGVKAAPGYPVWKALCPWHDDSKPKLKVDSVKGHYRCYGQGCRRHGDHLNFLQEYVGLGLPEAVTELQRLAGQVEFTVMEGYTGRRHAR